MPHPGGDRDGISTGQSMQATKDGIVYMSSTYSAIRSLKDNGHRIIGCFPLYPPVELLHSMGLTPVTLWGLRDFSPGVPLSDRHLQAYTCSVGRCLTEFVLRHGSEVLDGIFLYNACDTLRNLPEILQNGLAEQGSALPLFRLHIPASSLTRPADAHYLRERVRRLVRELEETFGTPFSMESFDRSVKLYRRQHELSSRLQDLVGLGSVSFSEFCRILNAGSFLPVEKHIEMLATAIEQSDTGRGEQMELPRVMVSGILPPSPGVAECIESSGLRVADNDIAMFKRTYGYTPPAASNPEEYYVDLYGNHHPCTTMLHTGDARIKHLRKSVRERTIRGFIFFGEKFCEYEYFEVPYLRKVLEGEGVRMLSLDFSLEGDESIGSLRTRIESFAETLRP